MKNLIRCITITAVLFLSVMIVHAGGFQVNEHGARATGMGGAVFANIYDASAIYFNPGALGFVPGTNIVFGSTLIFPSSTFTGPAPLTTETDAKSQMFYPSTLYASHNLGNGLAFGLGIYNPYGLGTEWPEDWPGRALGIKSTLRTFFFNPTVAYKIGDNLGIGAGFNYVYGTVNLTQALPLQQFGIPAEGKADFDGTGNGIGWNVGIYYKPIDEFTIGVAYRSSIDVDFEGEADLQVPQPLAQLLPGGDVSTGISLPANLLFGATYRINENLSLNAGFQYVFWDIVDDIVIDFKQKTSIPHPVTGDPMPIQDKQELALNYDDGFIVRFGVEYFLNEMLTLRGGYLFDSNPTPDQYMTPRLPDSDRHGISIGIGYKLSEIMTVDVSYMFLQFAERTVTNQFQGFNGTYNSSANLLGLNLKFHL